MVELVIIAEVFVALSLIGCISLYLTNRGQIFIKSFETKYPEIVRDFLERIPRLIRSPASHYVFHFLRHPKTISDPDLRRMKKEFERIYLIGLAIVAVIVAIIAGSIWLVI